MARQVVFAHGFPLHETPDAWRLTFLQDYTDSGARTALSHTCRDFYQWLLSDAERASCTLSLEPSMADDRVSRRLQSCKRTFTALGTRATKLTLRQQQEDQRVLMWAISALDGAARHVKSLTIDIPNITRTLLRAAASAFPALDTLHLGGSTSTSPPCKSTLIPPDLLPNLKHLTVGPVATSRQAAVLQGMAALLPHLTSLTYLSKECVYATLFNPASTSHTLRKLTLSQWLCNQLVQHLKEHAPALEHLSVCGVYFEYFEPVADQTCSWGTLEYSETGGLDLSHLDFLPQPAGGTLTLKLSGLASRTLHIRSARSEEVLGRQVDQLRRCAFPDVNAIRLTKPYGNSATATAIPLLQRYVAVLAPICSPGCALEFSEWPLTHNFVASLRDIQQQWPNIRVVNVPAGPEYTPLPPLQRLKFKIIDKDVLSWAGACARGTPEMAAGLLQVTKYFLDYQVCTWERMVVTCTDLCSIYNMPFKTEAGGSVALTVKGYLTCSLSVSQVSATSPQAKVLLQRFKSVHFQDEAWVTFVADPEGSAEPSQQVELLNFYLQLLALAHGIPCSITFKHFTLTPAILQLLPQLPAGIESVAFQSCSFLPDPHLYTSLTHLLPASFVRWDLHDGMSAEQFTQLCYAAPTNRTEEKPLLLEGPVTYEVAERLQAALQHSGVRPHVTIRGRQGAMPFLLPQEPEEPESEGE